MHVPKLTKKMVFICPSGFEDSFLVTFVSDLFAILTLLDFIKLLTAQNTIQARANQPENSTLPNNRSNKNNRHNNQPINHQKTQ
jgi:hypothetical protein